MSNQPFKVTNMDKSKSEILMKNLTKSLFKTFEESTFLGYLEIWDEDWTKDMLKVVFEEIKSDPKLKKNFIEYLKN